jgi:hypothetical protein
MIGLVQLERFFERAIRATFHDLALHEESIVTYLGDLLTRFARTEHLHPRGEVVARLETVVDMLLECQAAWGPARFHPEREVTVRRHIGDYTLFMTGIFREHVERVASTGFYVSQGKRAYRFVSEHDRASAAPAARAGGPLYARLADRFERWAGALEYARKVHFPDRFPVA